MEVVFATRRLLSRHKANAVMVLAITTGLFIVNVNVS